MRVRGSLYPNALNDWRTLFLLLARARLWWLRRRFVFLRLLRAWATLLVVRLERVMRRLVRHGFLALPDLLNALVNVAPDAVDLRTAVREERLLRRAPLDLFRVAADLLRARLDLVRAVADRLWRARDRRVSLFNAQDLLWRLVSLHR